MHRSAQPRFDHAAVERRSSSRIPVPSLIVALELPEPAPSTPTDTGGDAGSFDWAGSAVDISRNGLGLVLPIDVSEGTELLLTFKLDDRTTFSRVPARVVRTQPGLGLAAVRFRGWTLSDRGSLLRYLESC